MSIIDAAQTAGIVEHFDGYASTDPDNVYRQVWAIWHALSERGIRYSNADPAIERGPKVFSQRVRFLRETWNDRSANCIDGSVLIASVLQRIGIRSFLVLVPGHAFIGFYVDADAQRAVYLETTLLGASVSRTQSRPGFAATVPSTPQNRLSLNSFAAALAAGRSHHARVAAKLDGRHRPDYAVIDIGAARAFGIQPIDEPESSCEQVAVGCNEEAEDGFASGCGQSETLSIPLLQATLVGIEPQRERRAAECRRVRHLHRASIRLDQLLHDGQPNAVTLHALVAAQR